MPLESQLAHRNVSKAGLPFVSYISPTSTENVMVPGSQDILTDTSGIAQRRPGFSDNVETTPTTFVNLQRIFSWNRFDGTFIEMACDVTSTSSLVYKRVIGIDSSFVLLYTDSTSVQPFDFVVSNDSVYFSNGNTSRKWNPNDGLSNWGIAIGSINNVTGPNGVTAGANVQSATWTNPGNITANDGLFATLPLTSTLVTTVGGLYLAATNCGFALSPTSTILGILVEVKGKVDTGGLLTNIGTYLTKDGTNTIGGTKITELNTTNGFVSLGGTSELWGTTWSASDINSVNFGVLLYAILATPSTTVNYSIDFVRITIYSTGGPTVTVSATAGTMSATTGYKYVFCYGNSRTGHVSSPTPVSTSTGAFTNKLNVSVALTASTDTQVNQIRVFRTTDGGGGNYFEVATSPFANTTANITDSTADGNLNLFSLAPTPTFNDPPPAWQGMQYFAGRIWGFVNNKVWFTGLEEITNGVQEESVPSGQAGNFWQFDQPVTALAAVGDINQVLLVFCGGRIYAITGNTLDTFRRVLVSNRRGCRNRAAVTALGGLVAWLDSSSQVWASDGNRITELSLPIRPTIASITHANASLTFHASGKQHWLVLSDGTKLYVHDMDTEQWMPPWTVAAKYVYSGEISSGNYRLMLSTGTKALMLTTTGANNDNGVTYTPIMQTNLLPMVPDFRNSFYSYFYDAPTRTGQPWFVQVDTNNVGLGDVAFVADDDPTNASTVYTSIAAQKQDVSITFNRVNGTFLVQNVYATVRPTARWIGLKIKGANADDALKVFGYLIAYKETK